MLEVGADDRRRTLRAQHQVVAAAVLEEVDLLVDDVGALGAGAQEDAGVLEHRRLDLAVAVRLGDAHRRLAHPAPVGLVGGQDVGDAAGRFVAAEAWHKRTARIRGTYGAHARRLAHTLRRPSR